MGSMEHHYRKKNRLFVLLAAFFLTNALVAEFMGVKIFSLESWLGIDPIEINLFGEKIKGLSFTCGVLLWPFVFIMTDVINEYYGRKGVRFLSYLGATMIAYGFFMFYGAIQTPGADWWIYSSAYGKELHMGKAYETIFGQGLDIIVGSLTAFLLGQLVDVTVFHWVKQKTGDKMLWLRSTGSTLVSQGIDSYVVLFVAFYFARTGSPTQWPVSLVFAVGTLNYLYKILAAFALTPVIYLVHHQIDKWLGKDVANEMMKEAASS